MKHKIILCTIFILLVGCSNPQGEPLGDRIFTDNEKQHSCLIVETIARPNYEPKAIYILIDNSVSYLHKYDDAVDLLNKVLVKTMRPGDLISISLIGVETSSNVVSAHTFPTPENVEGQLDNLLIPTPTALTPTEQEIVSLVLEHENVKEDVEDRNFDIVDSFYCSDDRVDMWNLSYDLSDSNRQHLDFFEEIKQAMPIATGEESTDISSALFGATEFFNEATRQGYSHLELLILSDMHQTGAVGIWNPALSLDGIGTTIAMVPYNTVDDNEVAVFLDNREFWREWFEAAGVTEFTFLGVPNSNIESISILVGTQ